MSRDRTGKLLWVFAAAIALAVVPVWGQPTTPCMGGGQIGPCPGWVDTNGNGRWDTGEPLITFVCSPGPPVTMQVLNPWSTNCGDTTSNVIYFNSTDGATGCWNSAYRLNGPFFSFQQMNVTGFTGGLPTAFSFSEGASTGNGSLVGSGGVYNSLSITGGLNLLVGPFQGTDASGGGGAFNHVTIPWSVASALGMGGTCRLGTTDPQIFLPVVSLGGGQYQIQFNFACSPAFCSSPPLAVLAWNGTGSIPTLSEWGMIALCLGLATLGWWFLRRQQVLA